MNGQTVTVSRAVLGSGPHGPDTAAVDPAMPCSNPPCPR